MTHLLYILRARIYFSVDEKCWKQRSSWRTGSVILQAENLSGHKTIDQTDGQSFTERLQFWQKVCFNTRWFMCSHFNDWICSPVGTCTGGNRTTEFRLLLTSMKFSQVLLTSFFQSFQPPLSLFQTKFHCSNLKLRKPWGAGETWWLTAGGKQRLQDHLEKSSLFLHLWRKIHVFLSADLQVQTRGCQTLFTGAHVPVNMRCAPL